MRGNQNERDVNSIMDICMPQGSPLYGLAYAWMGACFLPWLPLAMLLSISSRD
jgi:hypothetical protein